MEQAEKRRSGQVAVKGMSNVRLSLLLAAVGNLSAGCVSTEMKSLVGSPVQEAQMRYGAPLQVIDMPDGRRAYQFRYGGGAVVIPGYSTTTATAVGNSVIATTSGTPGGIIQTEGCVLTFMAREKSGAWMIEDIRVPKGLVC